MLVRIGSRGILARPLLIKTPQRARLPSSRFAGVRFDLLPLQSGQAANHLVADLFAKPTYGILFGIRMK